MSMQGRSILHRAWYRGITVCGLNLRQRGMRRDNGFAFRLQGVTCAACQKILGHERRGAR